MQKGDDFMLKKKMDKEEINNAHDATEYSDNNCINQTNNTFNSIGRNSNANKPQRTMETNSKGHQRQRPMSSIVPNKEKVNGTRNKSAFKPMFSTDSTKDSINDFKYAHYVRMPRMQQIIEHNQQVGIEKQYEDMRSGYKKNELNKPKSKPKPLSKLNQLIYNQFYHIDYPDLDSRNRGQGDDMFITMKMN